MAKRELEEINAGSMADIAFLLLIFFLVTTTMDQEQGIVRNLPQKAPESQDKPPVVKERNVFKVLVNFRNQLLVEDELSEMSKLKDQTLEFLTNPSNEDDLPQMTMLTELKCKEILLQLKSAAKPIKSEIDKWEKRLKAQQLYGDFRLLPDVAIISLQNDFGTSYETYVQVQNEMQAAFDDLRNDLSNRVLSKNYTDLDLNNPIEKEQLKLLKVVFPTRISETKPKNLKE